MSNRILQNRRLTDGGFVNSLLEYWCVIVGVFNGNENVDAGSIVSSARSDAKFGNDKTKIIAINALPVQLFDKDDGLNGLDDFENLIVVARNDLELDGLVRDVDDVRRNS